MTSFPTAQGPSKWSDPFSPQEKLSYAQAVVKSSYKPETTPISECSTKQTEKFMKSVPVVVRQFAMSPEKYKSKLDAINHVLDITKALAHLPAPTVFKAPRTNLYCFYCKKPNHLIRECLALKAEVYRKNFPCRKCKNPTAKNNQTDNPLSKSIPLSKTKTRGGTIFEVFQANTNLNVPKESSL